jgi:hypothetical protein
LRDSEDAICIRGQKEKAEGSESLWLFSCDASGG